MNGRVNGYNRPLLPECVFPALLDLPDPLHSLECRLHQFAIVADWDISALLEIDCSILRISKMHTQ